MKQLKSVCIRYKFYRVQAGARSLHEGREGARGGRGAASCKENGSKTRLDRFDRLDLVDDALLRGELLALGPEVLVVREELELCTGCERVTGA